MSVSLSNSVLSQFGQFVMAGRSASASAVNHASAPERAKSSTTLRLIAGSLSGLPQDLHRNTAIGTPQIRCREMHQSGRVAIILDMRSSPHAGSHFTFLISFSVRERRVPPPSIGVSMEINHCSVAREITGLWQSPQRREGG